MDDFEADYLSILCQQFLTNAERMYFLGEKGQFFFETVDSKKLLKIKLLE